MTHQCEIRFVKLLVNNRNQFKKGFETMFFKVCVPLSNSKTYMPYCLLIRLYELYYNYEGYGISLVYFTVFVTLFVYTNCGKISIPKFIIGDINLKIL